MKANQMLNEIKTLLNIEVKLEEQKLENGTVVSAEAFEKDNEIFIVTDDEKIAMPVGEYLLEDGRLVVVEAEGLIADVREVSDEVPAKEEEVEETEDLEEEKKEEEKMADVADWEGMEKRIQNLEDAIASLKKEDVEMGVENGGLKSRTVKEEFAEEVTEEIKEEVKEELSAVKPIKHNPEASTPQKKQVQFAKGQFNTTLDRVLSKLNK
jgi:arginine decarboxylase-like protein